MKSKVTITGSKKAGYILTIEDKDSCQDMAIKHEELKEIVRLIKRFDKKS